MFRARAHHEEVKIALHSVWYHHTYRCIVKQKFCSSSWLITEINIPRCTVSKSKKKNIYIYIYGCLGEGSTLETLFMHGTIPISDVWRMK